MRRTLPFPLLRILIQTLLLVVWLAVAWPARAQGVEFSNLVLTRNEGALVLDYSARLSLSRAVEASDWPAGGAALASIRTWVGINLAIGVVIIGTTLVM